jgi:hypothetical protein
VSRVANLMVAFGPEDYRNVEAFSEWLRTHGGPGKGCGYLAEITGGDSRWGGWKSPECDVWAGALNHADLDAVLQQVRRIAWERPNELQVFLKDQEQGFFRIWMVRDGALRQFAPGGPDEDDPGFYPPGDD